MNNQFELKDETKQEIIVETLQQARAEINSRLQININLILQKIVTFGAALGFLINQKYDPSATYLVSFNNVQLLGFILVPIVAILYDVLIARNIRGISLLAAFIRTHIESLMPEVTLWEKYVEQEFRQDKNTGIENLFLLLFTLGTEFIAALIFFNQNKVYLLFIPALLAIHYWAFKAVQKLRGQL
jgi:hypothetical protein